MDEIGQWFQFNDYLATSFYAMIEQQNKVLPNDEPLLRNPLVYLHFEQNYGTRLDTNADGFRESYVYTCDNVYGIWATANLLHSMVLDNTTSRQMYHVPFYQQFNRNSWPYLASVDYPAVQVSSANFNANTNQLNLSLQTENNLPLKGTTIICRNIDSVKSVTVNGQFIQSYQLQPNNGNDLHHHDVLLLVSTKP